MTKGKIYGEGNYFAVYLYPDRSLYLSDAGYRSVDEAWFEGRKHESPKGDKMIGALYTDTTDREALGNALGEFYAIDLGRPYRND